ncbi:MAG: glutathione S-transferase family protein [Oligoflexales bacterium]|nr:glutathione S-transferase family protein [Oligoflexales bacterium]
MIQAYLHPQSSSAQRVHYFLEHAKIPHKAIKVDLATGEQHKAEYLAVNPFGVVPAITHDGFSLSESQAILRYLAQRFELHSQYPANLQDRARVDQIMDFTTMHISKHIGSLHWNTIMAPVYKMPSSQVHVDEANKFLLRQLPKLDRWLASQGGFLYGTNHTIADASFVPFVAQMIELKIPIADFYHVGRYAEKITNEAAWQKVKNASF